MPIVSDGIIPDGVWGNVPSGETYIAPIEGSAQGEIVINGALPGRVLAPREELILRFEAGRLVDAWPRGGEAHAHLYEGVLRHARAQNDPNWDVLGEIGLGANRRIRRLSGTSLLDEKKYGTIHIALGDNEDMGGEVRSLVHCDLVSLRPGVTIDDKPILSRGRITLREPDWREDHRALALPDDWHTRTLLSLSGIEAMVNGRGQLYRRWTTSSGRECGIPVGNEASATRAAGLWRAIKDSTRPIEMNELPLPSREAWRDDSDRLVYLLERYGLVRTN